LAVTSKLGYPVSYIFCAAGCFPTGRGVNLTTHPHLMLNLRIVELYLHEASWPGIKDDIPLTGHDMTVSLSANKITDRNEKQKKVILNNLLVTSIATIL
jgi:hypothetical protein